MEGNKVFPNDIFRDKKDHQGITVVVGCEFCTLRREEGTHDQRENMCHKITYTLYVLRNVAI